MRQAIFRCIVDKFRAVITIEPTSHRPKPEVAVAVFVEARYPSIGQSIRDTIGPPDAPALRDGVYPDFIGAQFILI